MISFQKVAGRTLAFSILFLSACNTPLDPGSMQPTEGYPFLTNIDEIKDVLEFRGLDNIEFREGDTVADIGAGNGYIEAMLAMFHDSVTFYIQDIDSAVCNPSAIDEVVRFYQELHGKAFTCTFTAVNGTDTDTRLPDNAFDKILMLWTYQYLKEPCLFISDVRENLKDDGLLYVINPNMDEDEHAKSLRRDYGWNVSPLEKLITDIIHCGFELRQISRHYDAEGSRHPYVMVFSKKPD